MHAEVLGTLWGARRCPIGMGYFPILYSATSPARRGDYLLCTTAEPGTFELFYLSHRGHSIQHLDPSS